MRFIINYNLDNFFLLINISLIFNYPVHYDIFIIYYLINLLLNYVFMLATLRRDFGQIKRIKIIFPRLLTLLH